MFVITKPNQLKSTITSDMVVDKMCEKLMKKIIDASNDGKHECSFFISGVYGNLKTGEFPQNITRDVLHNPDYKHFAFDDYSDEIKKRFTSAGYRIKPTGYIGGVWQLSEDICW